MRYYGYHQGGMIESLPNFGSLQPYYLFDRCFTPILASNYNLNGVLNCQIRIYDYTGYLCIYANDIKMYSGNITAGYPVYFTNPVDFSTASQFIITYDNVDF